MDSPVPQQRLDSWKEIAAYLKRDLATVRRWEKAGLPVRRIPGHGRRAVFAYAPEIDAWLATRRTAERDELAKGSSARLIALGAIAVLVGLSVVVWSRASAAIVPANLRIKTESDAIVAFESGRERWRFTFAPAFRVSYPELIPDTWRVMPDPKPAVFVAIANRLGRADDSSFGGELLELDLRGARRHSFAFDDHVAIAGKSFDPPWGVTAFAVIDGPAGRRIAVTAHHMMWSASLVTVLDENFHRQGTFVHNGWIEGVSWIAANRLLVNGFSDDRNGGTVALLDADALDRGQPIREVVMPRTELNLATASRFNRAVVQRTADRIVVRTIEVPAEGLPAADVIYDFSPALDLLSASLSARYLEARAELVRAGRLGHSPEAAPVVGPIHVWEPGTGWTVRPSPR